MVVPVMNYSPSQNDRQRIGSFCPLLLHPSNCQHELHYSMLEFLQTLMPWIVKVSNFWFQHQALRLLLRGDGNKNLKQDGKITKNTSLKGSI